MKCTLRSGSWLRCERPTEEEVSELLTLGMDEDMISDALDPHEVPRIEFDDEWTYLIARLPDTDDDFNDFTTPILFAHVPVIGKRGDERLCPASIDCYYHESIVSQTIV